MGKIELFHYQKMVGLDLFLLIQGPEFCTCIDRNVRTNIPTQLKVHLVQCPASEGEHPNRLPCYVLPACRNLQIINFVNRN